MTDRKSFVLQAEPGAGKTLLAQTMPGPVLMMDLEVGGHHGLDVQVWDGQGAWPEDLRDTTTVLVPLKTTTEVEAMIRRVMVDPNHPWETVALDSAHKLQHIAVEEARHENNKGERVTPQPNTPPSEANYGTSSRVMERLLDGGMRALATFEAVKPVHTCTVVGVDYTQTPYLPMVQPYIQKWMYYWFDMVTFLYAEDTDEETRVLVLNGHKDICRVKTRMTPLAKQKLGRSVRNPHLGKILRVVLAGERAAAKAANEQESNNE